MTTSDDTHTCYHCGIPAQAPAIQFDGKVFCCAGCKTVYEILSRNKLCQYYDLEKNPGITPSLRPSPRFEALDDPRIQARLIQFTDGEISLVRFHVPQMHCSSCIWLLEQLRSLDQGIIVSRVDFQRKTVSVRYSEGATSLRRIASLLASLGYEPELNFGTGSERQGDATVRSLYIKIGVAAFCFGNIMLFSLPEYLATSPVDAETRRMFGWINLGLALPAFFYSSSPFFDSAMRGLRKSLVTIDFPIALGIAIVFLRSAVDVALAYGPGYFDSLTGLIFFLLLGRLVQTKTYDHLNFGRKAEAYLPFAVTVRKNGLEQSVPVGILRPADRIVIRNQEIIPADAVVMSGIANIDYSFVTGESHPVERRIGDVVYAGGKQIGTSIELELINEASQSSLMSMWSDFGSGDKSPSRLLTLSNSFGKYFTAAILIVAAGTALYWWMVSPSRILDAVTAVLIISCPCALALAAPFTFWTAMRQFGANGLYLRNASVIEAMAKIDTIVFDKTGTVTRADATRTSYVGPPPDEQTRALIATVVRSSTHPLSRSIAEYLRDAGERSATVFEEIEGQGAMGVVDGQAVRVGSAAFVGVAQDEGDRNIEVTAVFASIDGRIAGHFQFENVYRDGTSAVFAELGTDHTLAILSGDGERERPRLEMLYDRFLWMKFRMTPEQKREAVLGLQRDGRGVMMIGDGLNDAGALWQSDAGIAVTEDISAFSPACDGILTAASFGRLNSLKRFASRAVSVVYWGLLLSLVYNLTGLFFAVQGALSPILAAILMPLSSLSVVIVSTVATRFVARRTGLV